VIALLAREMGVARRSIQIIRGHGSARKQIRIAGLSAGEVSTRLSALYQSKS
jgi:uncharacterized protein YggU (UPF0235/DUF167 family)